MTLDSSHGGVQALLSAQVAKGNLLDAAEALHLLVQGHLAAQLPELLRAQQARHAGWAAELVAQYAASEEQREHGSSKPHVADSEEHTKSGQAACPTTAAGVGAEPGDAASAFPENSGSTCAWQEIAAEPGHESVQADASGSGSSE